MKNFRYAKIREIIKNQVIETQEDLANALLKEGIEVTQATISRDIKDMMLIKVPYGDGRYRYASSPEEDTLLAKSRVGTMFRSTVNNITYSGNLLVIQTMPGAAQAVAFGLDNTKLPEVIGSIAGDDTILLVLAEGSNPAEVKKRLYRFFREG